MDRNIHTDDFERLLRERSDEFRMYPSKRTWYSIYNNIHPGRKWPSVVVSMTLITILFLIGYLNSNSPRVATNHTTAYNNAVGNFPKNYIIGITALNFSLIPYTESTTSKHSSSANSNQVNNEEGIYSFVKVYPHYNTSILSNSQINVYQKGKAALSNIHLTAAEKIMSVAFNSSIKNQRQANGTENVLTVNKYFTNKDTASLEVIPNDVTGDVIASLIQPQNILINSENKDKIYQSNEVLLFKELDSTYINQLPTKLDDIAGPSKKPHVFENKKSLTKEEKEWIDNYALYNRPLPKKWKGKLALQMYATTSVVYRSLKNDPDFGITPNSAPFVIPNSTQDIDQDVVHKPSIGLEVGAGIKYLIFKGIKLKTGLQLNFTRYNALAYHNTHPVATKLTMHDYTTNSTYELYRTSPYSNKSGLDAVKLHNQTLQLSLPVGVDVKVIGGDKLQLNLGATLQPTVLLGGKSYLISSDRRNYVKESAMLSRWNLNAGFETFITYKSKGLILQIGPQFRTQLFSTNSKTFAVEERLMSYGIKFGISRTL